MRWPLAADPFDVQQLAFDLGRDRDRFGYFLEQGLGKTANAYADFVYNLHMDRVDTMVVLCPNYLKSGWEDERQEWHVDLPSFLWPDRPTSHQLRSPCIIVMNYEAASTSGGAWLMSEVTKRRRSFLTLDESSAIKNPQSRTTKQVTHIATTCYKHRLLSGTPMTQSIMDWYPQLRMLGELDGWNPYQFRNHFARMGGFKGKQIVGVKEEHQPEFQEILNRCSIRALKKDWTDLPEKIYPKPWRFEMSKTQIAAYRTMLDEFFVAIDDEEVTVSQIIHMTMKLQQISRGFIIDGDRVHWLVDPKNNPALRVAREGRATISGKVIHFAFYRPSVDMLVQSFENCAVLRGGMETEDIAAQKRKFNEDPDCRDIVAQLSVGAKGHTLLGDAANRCSTSLFFENTYSLEVRKQAEDRNHRHGQDRATSYIDLVGSATDEKPIAALQRKQDLVESIVDAVRTTRAAFH